LSTLTFQQSWCVTQLEKSLRSLILSLSVFLFSLTSSYLFGQGTTARLDGTVSDSSGGAVAGASVTVVNPAQNQKFDTKTDDKGHWSLPAMAAGVYSVSISQTGFKSATLANIKIDAGVPATANVTLEVGNVVDRVEVTAGADVVQSDTATLSTTLQGTQIHDLPFTSRNATELIATQPGTQTTTGVRYSLVNGLPQSSINITLDGVNIQDDTNKSTDAIFNNVQPRAEAVEEMTMTTSAAGADNSGEGAVQIKFVTRGGTNQFHGALWEANRNSALAANYYFNSVTGNPRDVMNLNQFGGSLGGPILKNKLFFFTTFEAFRFLQSNLETSTQLAPSAANGIFTYKDSTGNVHNVNLYQLASNADSSLPASIRQFPTTPDPTLQKAFSLINQLTATGGQLSSRIVTNNDYNRDAFSFPAKGVNNRNFETSRLDYNITDKHHLNFVWNYQTNLRSPDTVNNTVAVLPGTGTVLGSPTLEGQTGINFTGSFGLRSTLSSTLTNELNLGLQGGTDILGSGLSPADYKLFNGIQPNFGPTTTASSLYTSNPYMGSYTGYAPRNAPVKQIADNLSKSLGNHLLTFGGNYTQVNYWQAASNSSLLNTVFLSQATGDPDNTGATSLFTAGTLPGSTPTQQSDAAALYALITGRISSIGSSVVQNEQTKVYGQNFQVDRDRLREFGFYLQDSWRVNANLTLNYGLRYDRQLAFQNLDGLYTTVGIAGLYGVSGVGNLFAPGTLTGSAPVFSQTKPGQGLSPSFGAYDPTVGLAYKLPKRDGPLQWLTGKGDSVIRAGGSISTIREGMGFYTGVLGANQGRALTTTVSPVNNPTIFPAGSSLLRDGSYPTLNPATINPNYPNPSYPLPVQNGQTVNGIDPNLKREYVESWNVGFQRELDHNTVMEVRYVGNHGVGLWRSVNLNEVNIYENGFLSQFQAAQNNLNIARAVQPAGATPTNNFGNQGLPGQVNVPILSTALGTTTDQTTATYLVQGQAGASANSIATSASRMANLTKAHYPVNLFQVNPIFANANILMNQGSSTYNSGQVEIRRRLTDGLQVQGSYAFSKSLTNENSGTAINIPTLRDIGGEKGPSPFDIRHGFKFTWIYQLPFGPGRSFVSNRNGFMSRVIGGWEISGVGRLQSGTPENLLSGYETVNQNDSGVVLRNITTSQLQSEMGIYKTSNVSSNGAVTGTVYYLPQALIKNTLAAFGLGTAALNPNAPYIGPATTAGQEGNRIFLYGPWLSKWDVSLVKRTPINERMNFEFRVQALNVFNFTNFELYGNGGYNVTINSSFGQTTTAFRDFNNTNDPGSRTLELVARFNF
jgi:hypothetical protein